MADEQRSLRHSVISGALWQFSSKFGSSLANFLIQMVLARLLVPEEFALIALTVVFISIAEHFIDGGFASALVQKREIDDLDLSSAFYFNVVVGVVVYIAIFMISPYVAVYFNAPELDRILQAVGFGIIISSFGVVQSALLQRNMLFRKQFVVMFSAVVGGGIAGIVGAYYGLGVWALVLSQLVNRVIYTILITVSIHYRPKPMFSFARIRHMFSFGGNIFLNNIIGVFYNQIPAMIFGRVFTKDLLGYLTQANRLSEQICANIQGTLIQVFFPAFSKLQDDPAKLRSALLRAASVSAFVYVPVIMGLIAAAKPAILVIFGPNWEGSVAFLRLVALTYLFQVTQDSYMQALLALGRSRAVLVVDFTSRVVAVALYLIALPFGPYWVVAAIIPIPLIRIVAYYVLLKPTLSISLGHIVWGFCKPFALSCLMAIPVFLIEFIDLPNVVLFALQIVVGVGVYALVCHLLKVEEFTYLREIVKERFGSRKARA